jgi:predicted alpha-1,6-mannanase (GH76 family)
LEALSTTYALYPDNETVKKTYVDALTNGVDKYKVTKATITNTQTKERFKNITYYNASAGGSGDYYYDDNAWICIQFLYAYELLQDEEYLNRAKELLTFFWTGWDDSLGGGIYWDKSYSGKNTCADGPIAICYLWAYQLTQEEDYLTKGTQIYIWMKETLRDSNYLYKDALGLDGGENSWKADYNQGTPIYAACLLYEITGDESYLKDAKQTAQAALGLAFTSSGRGTNQTVKMNGNPIYKSWCVGWLMRGFMRYVQDSKKAGSYFSYMETVLDKVIAAVDSDGYYDPYFLTGDWGSESVTDVLQPSGVATVMMLCAYYDVYIAPSL